MFRSYDHHQAEKYIATLGLLNWQRIGNLILRANCGQSRFWKETPNWTKGKTACMKGINEMRIGALYTRQEETHEDTSKSTILRR
jgi:hypothetical protein